MDISKLYYFCAYPRMENAIGRGAAGSGNTNINQQIVKGKMSRPFKKGLSYFPLDTNFMLNRKIQRLTLEHGSKGMCVYLTLLMEIYGSNGYYIPYSSELFFDIGFLIKLTEEETKAIVESCVRIGLFDAKLLREKRIYTSTGIQQRFMEINKRSKFQMNKQYLTKGMRAIIEAKMQFCATENGLFDEMNVFSAPETPTKGKGKGKGNKKEKEKEKGKGNEDEENESGEVFLVQSDLNAEENEENKGYYGAGADTGAAARRAELLRLAAAATKGTDA